MTSRIRLIINGLLVLALAGAGALVILGWHEIPEAAVWGRLLIGVGLAAAIAIGVMFFLPLELRANLTLTGIATLMALWVGSWILYEPERTPWELRQRDYAAAARDAGVTFDTRPITEVINELRESGVDAVSTLSAWALFRRDSQIEGWVDEGTLEARKDSTLMPLAGRSQSTTVACNEQGDYLIVESDNYGYNNPDHVYDAESPILLLGDSFAFGYCVRPRYDIGNQLRARDAEVVNLGYPGTGPLIQLAQLREYGRLFQPSAIVWLYFNGNDLVNLAEEHREPALRRYLDPGHRQNLPTRQAEIDAFWSNYMEQALTRAESRGGLPLGDILLLQPLRARLGGQALAEPAPRRGKAGIERFEEALEAMVAEAERLDAPLYFVFLPTYPQFAEEDGNASDDREGVLNAVRARGLPIIDFEARLLETGDPLQYFPFRKPGHYTEAAYGLLAEQVLERLHQDSLRVPASALP